MKDAPEQKDEQKEVPEWAQRLLDGLDSLTQSMNRPLEDQEEVQQVKVPQPPQPQPEELEEPEELEIPEEPDSLPEKKTNPLKKLANWLF